MITINEARAVIESLKKDENRRSFSTQEFITVYKNGCGLSYDEMLARFGSVKEAHKRIGLYLRRHCSNRFNLDIRFFSKETGRNVFDRDNLNARWVIVSREEVV